MGDPLKMSLYDVPNMTGGIDETLVEVATAVPSFIIGLLIFVFGLVFIGGSSTQKRKTGYSDMPMWATMASLSVFLITLMLSLKEGLINIEILGIVISVTIFSALWLFLSRGKGEQ